jgi:hypothetical protein
MLLAGSWWKLAYTKLHGNSRTKAQSAKAYKKWFCWFLFKSVCDLREIKIRYSLTNFRYFQKELTGNFASERKNCYICPCKQE